MTSTMKEKTPLLRPLSVLVLSAAILIAAPALAQDGHDHDVGWMDGTPRAVLIGELSQFHHPPTLSELEALDLDVDLQQELIEIAQDDSLVEVPRKRAITLLANYPTEETLTMVEDLLATEDNLTLVGRTALLIGDLGQTHPEWALAELQTLADHEDFVVREMTVKSLALLRPLPTVNAQVDDTLMQLVIAERNPSVQDALQTALDKDPVLQPASGGQQIRRVTTTP